MPFVVRNLPAWCALAGGAFVAWLAVVPVSAHADAIKPADKIQVRWLESRSPPIKIDGKVDEPLWAEVPAFDDFVVLEPDTLARGPHATLLRFLHTDRGLYLAAVMEQPPNTLIKRLSGRDVRELNRDSINVTIDPTGEGRYAYWFGINLGDSLMDGTAVPERLFSNEWDGPWRGASAITDAGWSAEFFIPWGMMPMPSAGDTRQMGIYFSRKVAYLDERWGWPALPSTQPKFMSALHPIELSGVEQKQQINFYPFSAVTLDRFDEETRYKAGADVFWRPSSNFQVNATVNPDFGSVESDDVVINLTATETFFPEKRLFFVEGQEVFVASPRADTRGSGVGSRGDPTTLINTRRIGGTPRAPIVPTGADLPARELIQPVELAGAAKLTGQFGRFRYGVLGAFEKEAKFDATGPGGGELNLHQEGSDYGVARLLYEDQAGGAYRAFGFLSTAVLHDDGDAMVSSLDWHYLTPAGKLKMDGQVFMSDIDGVDTGFGGFLDFEYTFRKGVQQRLGIEYYDEHVDINDLGFLARNDAYSIRTAHTRTSSNLSWARDNQFDVRGSVRRNIDGRFVGGGLLFSNKSTFDNLTSLTVRATFRPGSFDDLNSFGNGLYRIEQGRSGSFQFQSDPTKRFLLSATLGFNEENLGGDTYQYKGEVTWRPMDNFSLSAVIDYQDRDGWLLHQEDANFTTFEAEQWLPRLNIDYFLSARQQFRISVQWVGIKAEEDEFFLIPERPGDLVPTAKPVGPSDDFAISDLVFQARFRWEIAPLSDLFVVYTRASDIGRGLNGSSFSDLLDEAWDQPIGDQVVVKLRYRFGN